MGVARDAGAAEFLATIEKERRIGSTRIHDSRTAALWAVADIAVSIGPGATTLTRMPYSASSTAITSLRVITAPLEAP